jgi:hypothetical protein
MIYVQTVLLVFGILASWVVVRRLAHRYSTQHPEFGALREEGEGCGCGNKRCGEAQCKREKR